MSTSYLAVVKAEYGYESTNDEELSVEENQILYVLEDDDVEWWTVRIKQSPSAGILASDAPTGLVPASYVIPLPPTKQVTAMYEYTATTDEEISIQEDGKYDYYEDDGEWALVGAVDRKEVGYAPSAYFDLESSVSAATDVSAIPVPPPAPPAPPMPSQSTSNGSSRNGAIGEDRVRTWNVTLIVNKKNKKKGTLGIGNGGLFFSSEIDKAPVQHYSLKDMSSMSTEKGKHLHINLSGEELYFHVDKDDMDDVASKIRSSQDFALSGGGSSAADDQETYSGPKDTGNPAPPPPPPAPPAPGMAGAALKMPPPPRRMYSESSNSSDDETSQSATSAPSASFIPAPPAPPPMPTNLSSTSPIAAPPTSSDKKAVAAYDFTAAGSDELSMVEGETLFVLDDSQDDWWKVRNARGEEGEVPASYVEMDSAGDVRNDENFARQAQDDEKEERRKDRERKKLRELEDQARGMTLPEIRAPPRRPAAAASTWNASPPPVAPIPVPPPQPPLGTSRSRSPPPMSPAMREASGHGDRDDGKERHRPREREFDKDRNTDRERSNGHAPPVEKTKPSLARVRTWKDRSGAFKVDAEFVGMSGTNNEKIRLHKLNGVVIEVPVEKMSAEDIRVLEHITKRRVRPRKDDDLDKDRRRERGDEREKDNNSRRDRDREDRHKARLPSESAAGKRMSSTKGESKKSETDWFEFFLNAGCDVDDCSRYAANFERDRIDESILPDLESGTLRSLGMREGDIIRLSKYIKSKYGSTAAGGGNSSSSQSAGPDIPQPPGKESRSVKEDQMLDDEELARKLQEDLNAGRDGTGLFTTKEGGVKNTRRGRPQTNRSAPSAVSFDSITSSLTGDRSITPEISRVVSPDIAKEDVRRSSSTQPVASGFDDDAWTLKPSSKGPALVDTSDSSPSMPTNSKEASNAQALTDAYLESMGLAKNSRPASAPVHRQAAASPVPPNQSMYSQNGDPNQLSAQQTGYYGASSGNVGPRAPPAPIPVNQQLLNPLIPTNTGMIGFVPTRNQGSPMPMMAQQTGFQQSMQTGYQQAQPTGYQPPHPSVYQQVQQPSFQPQQTGYQPQPTGFQQPQPTGFQQPLPQPIPMQQPPYGGGIGFQQPQPTGYPMSQMTQLSIQPTGSPMFNQQVPQAPPPPPVQTPQTQTSLSSTNSADFQPSNIFAQMKAGQFAKSSEGQPQQEQKYDALRPQQTNYMPGMPGGYGQQPMQQQVPQQQMGMGMGMSMTGMQALQSQPTGFAPGGYIQPQQQMMYGQPAGYPYRQF